MMNHCMLHVNAITNHNRGFVSESERLSVMADLLAYSSWFSSLFCDEFVPEHLSSVGLNFSGAMSISDKIAIIALNLLPVNISYLFASLTPPCNPLSKWPLPLPPASTCALITAAPPAINVEEVPYFISYGAKTSRHPLQRYHLQIYVAVSTYHAVA